MPINTIQIKSLDAEGRGVGHLSNEDGTPGKVVFVEGALPGEVVHFETVKRKSKWELAKMISLFRESPVRAKPNVPHFSICGGCSMQHVEPSAQIAMKQRVLEDNLWHIGRVRPERMLRPIYGPYWGYRFRARLSVNYVPKKGGILVGFRERQSRYVVDMKECHVLPRHISDMLVPLPHLIESLSSCGKFHRLKSPRGDGNQLITSFAVTHHGTSHNG